MTCERDTFLVTGASSGIGRACASLLLEKGACVTGIDLAPPSISSERYRHVVTDVCDEEAVDRAANEVEESVGPLQGVVNAAGVFAVGKSVLELELADFTRVVSTNLTGTFVVGRAVARRMAVRGRGKIVNVACIRSSMVRAGMAEYAASKGGVAALTAAMAVDLSPKGIQVNAIAPGFTWTGFTNRIFVDPEMLAAHERLVPAARVAQPDDIARPILFLLSGDADYITGQVLFADGGFSICK